MFEIINQNKYSDRSKEVTVLLGNNDRPTDQPIDGPTYQPTDQPNDRPSDGPTDKPTDQPTDGQKGSWGWKLQFQ